MGTGFGRGRRLTAMLLAATLAVAACGGDTTITSPSPTASFVPTGTIDWKSCPVTDPVTGGNPELLCATITVPRDYLTPDGPTIELAVALLPAADQANKVGPLLLNFGGPGASGINILAESGRGVVPAEIGNRFDLVAWDPRGVNRSAPVNCLSDIEMDDWAATPGIPDRPTTKDWTAALNDAQWFADKCKAGSGDLLAYIGTTASARDMESIRVGLGVAKLDYLGFSYGTALGAVFATLFPASTGHLILDGAVDMAPTDESEYGEQGVSLQGALNRLFAWCDADSACPFGGGSSRKAFDALMNRLDDRPLELQDGRSLNSTLAWTGVIMTLYNRDYWDYAVQGLAGASEGDGYLLSLLADAYNDRSEDGSYKSNIMEAFPAISCIDSPTTPSIARYKAIYEKFVDRAPDFAAGQASGGLLCGVWPYKSADPLPKVINGAGAAPIMVVGTTGDPATPYTWAERMANLLESASLLTYVGEGHTGVGGKSACIDDAAITFLVTGTLPADGTRCND
ncbi:MAG: alpha/beta hydrolase [Chloroflexi bacterium]|nr:alpha/beta hydrolase [Chloroflexota bacterium]